MVTVRGEPVNVYGNQNIVWITFDDALRLLAASLETGHRRDRSIDEDQLRKRSGDFL
jgi:hypothetical protein